MQQAATFHYQYIYIIQFFKAQGQTTGGRYDVKISEISVTHIPVENSCNIFQTDFACFIFVQVAPVSCPGFSRIDTGSFFAFHTQILTACLGQLQE